MKNLLKKVLSCVLMALLVLSVAACGNGKESSTDSGNGGTTEPTRLTIFMASDRLKGSNESKVISAVEDKFLFTVLNIVGIYFGNFN